MAEADDKISAFGRHQKDARALRTNAAANKTCKNAAETSLIVFEIDRRTILIAEAEGVAPSDDLLTSVLCIAMDPGTRSHASGKIDVEKADYNTLRKTVAGHTNLEGEEAGTPRWTYRP